MNLGRLRRASTVLGMLVLCCGSLAAQGLSSAERQLLEKLVLAEARGEGELGMALVARSVLNRTALVQARRISPGTYNARGRNLRSIVYAKGQYEPVSSGTINARRTSQQRAEARRAVALAQDTRRLDQALQKQGVSSSARNRLMSATGFRGRGAFSDKSQNYNKQSFRRHNFNSDRFSRKQDVKGEFQKLYGKPGSATSSATSKLPTGEAIPIPKPRPVRAGEGGAAPAGTAPSASATRAPTAQNSAQASSEASRPAIRPGLKRGSKGQRVRELQSALNAAGTGRTIKADGDFGRKTQEALKAYQRKHGLRPTGRLDAQTAKKLSAGETKIPIPTPRPVRGLTAEQLRTVMPRLSAEQAKLYVGHLNRAMQEGGIRSAKQRAAFLATLAHESNELSRFEPGASAGRSPGGREPGARGPTNPALRANEPGARGPRAKTASGVSSPSLGIRLASKSWQQRGGNKAAQELDFKGVTRKLGGSPADFSARLKYYSRAVGLLGRN